MKKAYFFVALSLLPAFAFAQVNDAQQLLSSIRAVPAYHSLLLPLETESRAYIMFTKEERAQKKIRSISECVDNNRGGLSKEKRCINTTYDEYGNITSTEKTDSTGKIVLAYKWSNKTDAKGNVTSSKITTGGGMEIELTQTFNEKGLVTMRRFSALVPALTHEPEEIRLDEEPPREDFNYTEIYTYDNDGRLLNYSLTYGWTKEKMDFTWNENGQLLTRQQKIMTTVYYPVETSHNETHFIDSVATRTFAWSYEYDPASGYLVNIRESRSDFPFPGTLNYTYDKNGNITLLRHTFSRPEYNSKEVTLFDAQGRKVKTESYGGKEEALYSASTIEHSTAANGNVTRKWMSFTNTGYTESWEVYDRNGLQKELHGFHNGHTTGNATVYRNTFRTVWTYEFYR